MKTSIKDCLVQAIQREQDVEEQEEEEDNDDPRKRRAQNVTGFKEEWCGGRLMVKKQN